MKFEVTPEIALFSVKLWLFPLTCWPLPKDASRRYRFVHGIAWCIAVFIPAHLIPTSIMHSAMGPPDPAIITKNMAECLALFITSTKIIIYRVQHSRLQIATADLEEYLRTAGTRERELLVQYLKRCGSFYAAVEALCVFTGIAFACGPLVLPQPLPGHSEYPFEWKDKPRLKAFLYFTHVLATYEICAAAVIDIQIAFLLWTSGVRFEILAESFEAARSAAELHKCIGEHQQLLASTHEIAVVARYFILDVILNTGVTNVCVGYQFVSHQPIEVMVQFLLMFFITCLEIAMYAWPADNLLTVSENIAQAVYSSPWFERAEEVGSSVNIIMMRSQKPVRIGLSGILAAMNLDFYARYLSTSFSYFTTMRAVFG